MLAQTWRSGTLLTGWQGKATHLYELKFLCSIARSFRIYLMLFVSCPFRPQFVDSIKDEKLKQWAIDLNGIWKQLGRKVSHSLCGTEYSRTTVSSHSLGEF